MELGLPMGSRFRTRNQFAYLKGNLRDSFKACCEVGKTFAHPASDPEEFSGTFAANSREPREGFNVVGLGEEIEQF